MLTLSQAQQALSRVVDNGVCVDDPRVTARINEAQARLHALGDWVGVMARFIVPVDPQTRTFEIPHALQSVTRAAQALPDSVDGLLCENEYAFVLESSPVLSLQQVSPTKFRVISDSLTAPSKVDIAGKYKMTPAENPGDILVVGDLFALKQMILAIFREENNMPDQAAPLVQAAVAHLQAKTESAVSNARRALANSLSSGLTEGTMGYARAKLALAVNNGLRLDDHNMIEILGEAERRLLHRGREWRSYIFRSCNGEFSCPREIETLLRVDADGVPTRINSHWFEYTQNGWGYQDITRSFEIVHRGPNALHTDLPETSKLTLFCDSNERNLVVLISGLDVQGLPVSEEVVLNSAEARVTMREFARVDSIKKDAGVGNVFIMSGDVEVAMLTADQTDSTITRYRVPASVNCCGRLLRVIARPRWIPKPRDTSRLQVDNIPALTNMAMSIMSERAGDKDNADAFEGRAIRFYEEAFTGKEVSHQRRGEIQQRSFVGGTIRAIR
jgi:hypothetical protein